MNLLAGQFWSNGLELQNISDYSVLGVEKLKFMTLCQEVCEFPETFINGKKIKQVQPNYRWL